MHDRLKLDQSKYRIPYKVSDPWLSNCKKWDENKIIALFGQQTLQVLLQIPLMVGDEPDFLCWKPAPNGICSSKSAYKMLVTEEALSNPPSNIPMQVLQILRHVWADKTIQP